MRFLKFLKPRARFFAILCVVQWPIGRIFADVWWVELTTHFLPQQISLFIACLAIWLLPATRRGLAAMIAVVGLAVAVPMVMPILATPLPSSVLTQIRVIGFNVLTSNPHREEAREWIESQLTGKRATIVVLLEVNDAWVDSMKPLEAKLSYSYVHPRSDNFGIAVYSSVRLESVDVSSLEVTCEAPQLSALATIGDKTIRLLGVHTLPPSAANFDIRNECLKRIEEEALGEIPTVVIGDLNTSPWSPWFPKKLEDPFPYLARKHTWSALSGIVSTSLDHILVNDKLVAHYPEVGPDLGSDHRPVTAELRIK